MSKSANIYTRVEPELKAQVEAVLSKLGIPVANAINLFLHQVVLHNGIPFDVKIPPQAPLNCATLTKEQLDAEIEKGVASLNAGKIMPANEVRAKMQRHYSL
jgi:DNA-damage-inducible protein J